MYYSHSTCLSMPDLTLYKTDLLTLGLGLSPLTILTDTSHSPLNETVLKVL